MTQRCSIYLRGGVKIKNIITIQHCEAEHHLNGMVGGSTDWPITEKGLADARKIARLLAVRLENASKYKLLASDMIRTRQTAEAVAEQLKLTPIYKPALREIKIGDATGKSVEWLNENRLPRESVTAKIYYKPRPDAESLEELY